MILENLEENHKRNRERKNHGQPFKFIIMTNILMKVQTGIHNLFRLFREEELPQKYEVPNDDNY